MFLFGDNENVEIKGQYEYMSTKVMGTQNLVVHYQSYVYMYISANIPLTFTVPLSYYYIMTLSQSQVYVTTG